MLVVSDVVVGSVAVSLSEPQPANTSTDAVTITTAAEIAVALITRLPSAQVSVSKAQANGRSSSTEYIHPALGATANVSTLKGVSVIGGWTAAGAPGTPGRRSRCPPRPGDV
ncbi:hypothetical protein MPUL_29170 [Mycolicibacterium pulveris]|uniref:Uncharacterized protein n=1 Tax=Mycolicibacterium pulveris TaxID=36813 RepID=A0A7I7UMB7_MYCPV|nr:hypothetical protein MPUL_29170 [Mycolicibacterium pulveris]